MQLFQHKRGRTRALVGDADELLEGGGDRGIPLLGDVLQCGSSVHVGLNTSQTKIDQREWRETRILRGRKDAIDEPLISLLLGLR